MTNEGPAFEPESVECCFEFAGADARLSNTAIQAAGSKGWDGLAISRVER